MGSTRDLFEEIMMLAYEAGAEDPQLGESSDGSPVVVDTDNGDVYQIKLEKMV